MQGCLRPEVSRLSRNSLPSGVNTYAEPSLDAAGGLRWNSAVSPGKVVIVLGKRWPLLETTSLHEQQIPCPLAPCHRF